MPRASHSPAILLNNLEPTQLVRAKGCDHGDSAASTPSRKQNPPYPRFVMSRVKRVPLTIQIRPEPQPAKDGMTPE
jgi:hypothetical protein